MEHITIQGLLSEDFYSISYYAYDKAKRINCIITFSKVPTSWVYSIDYN